VSAQASRVVASAPAPPGLPRVLAGLDPAGPLSLDRHLGLHGELPGPPSGLDLQGLVAELDRAGLRGRGGAAFPAGAKLRAVARSGRQPVVVVNAIEAEPASSKDRLLLQRLPHLVLDGAQLAAQALGADQVIVCLAASARATAEGVQVAVDERARLFGGPRVSIAAVPDGYVSGEETALLGQLNGRPALPTLKPPYPAERGVGRRPALINNVETLAQVALIARHGASWFAELGTPAEAGSALVSLAGGVARPGVYEIEFGTDVDALIAAAGGATVGIRAVLIGGYAGGWIDGQLRPALTLDDVSLAEHGASLAAGIVFALPDGACGVAETAHVASYLAAESAGQCGPCLYGLAAIAETVSLLARGEAPAGAPERLTRWVAQVAGRGACRHPDGAARFIASALRVFAPEFADHARHGPCEACPAPALLPTPGSGRQTTGARA